MSRTGLLLAVDTATRTPALGLAEHDGKLLAGSRWQSRHRHGEALLEELDRLLGQVSAGPRDLTAICAGTGPGSFTGLRIGLATAKVLAHSLALPLAGVSTTRALAIAAGEQGDVAVTLPAGVADRYVHRLRLEGESAEELGPPVLVASSDAFVEATRGSTVVAVDLAAADVDEAALVLGRRAIDNLAQAVAGQGALALRAGRTDDAATLVPAYVALPRGIRQAAEEMQWSPDLR